MCLTKDGTPKPSSTDALWVSLTLNANESCSKNDFLKSFLTNIFLVFFSIESYKVLYACQLWEAFSALWVFGSRKKFSTTYAIVLFFSPDLPWKFQISQNCAYDFHEILHSHSTPEGAPACAMASKSYDWNVRNIARISPKTAKKQRFFDFFRFSQKLSIWFERNFVQSFYTILESYMCNGIKIVCLGFEQVRRKKT